MEQELKKLGLSPNETLVYLKILELGSTTAGPIISGLSLHRQSVYNALDELEKKELLIKSVKNKISHYRVNDPKILIDNLKKQELIAERLSKQIKEKMKAPIAENIINIYEGVNKIRKFYIDTFKQMSKNSCFYILSGEAQKFVQMLGNDFIQNEYDKVRIKRNIKSLFLTSENLRGNVVLGAKELDSSVREYRFLPYHIETAVSTIIWEDSIHYQFYNDATIPFLIEIKNKNLRDSMASQFEMMWKMAKE